MINFNDIPRTEELTYTVFDITEQTAIETALKIAGETDWTCYAYGPFLPNKIATHCPSMTDTNSVIVCHFRSPDILQKIKTAQTDPDVWSQIDKQNQAALEQHAKYYCQ